MLKIDPKAFWARLDYLLEVSGTSIAEVCRDTGIKLNSIYSQRKRQGLPDLECTATIAGRLSVDFEYLATGKGSFKGSYQPRVKEVADLLEADPSKLPLVRLALGLAP